MRTFYQIISLNIRKQPLVWGLALLFVLPPIGMLWLFVLGVRQAVLQIKGKQKTVVDPIGVLLMLMVAASAAATVANRQLMDLLSTLIMAAMLGIYLYLYNHRQQLHYHQYIWIVIWGGIYIIASDKIFGFISQHVHVSPVVALLTGNLLLGFPNHVRLYGSAYNPNYACYLLILSLSFLLVEILHSIQLRNYRSLRLTVVLLFVLDLGIYQTGSRAGFMIMIGLHLLFLLMVNRWIFAGSALLMAGLTPAIFHLMPRAGSTEMSFNTRQDIWSNGFHVFLNHPLFGTTSLGFQDAYLSVAGTSQPHPHNLLLAVFASSGIFCGLFFMAIVLFSTYCLIHVFFQDMHHRYKIILFLFALPTLVEYGIMDFTLSSPQIMLIVMPLLASWMHYLRQRGVLTHYHSFLLPRGYKRWKTERPEMKKRSAMALTSTVFVGKKVNHWEKY